MLKIDLNKDLDVLRNAKVKDELYLSGKIYSGRDQAHKRLKEIVESGKKPDLDFKNTIIYYMGPTPTRPGYAIGSCGPTSSYRMDNYLETMLNLGILASLGKGDRAPFVKELVKKYKSPYLITIGGASAYLAECVTSSKIVLFPDLGAEAVYELVIKDFPVYVAYDIYGGDIFE